MVQALLPLLQDEDSDVRSSASKALEKLGINSEPLGRLRFLIRISND